MSEEITSQKGIQNDSTRVGHLREAALWREPPLGPREAFLLAHDRIRGLAEIARRPGIVAVAVTPEGRVADAALVKDGRALIVGRHSRCGLRLGSPRMALRQLVVLARKEGEAMVTRVWDLDTGTPFLTEDGQPNAAVIADGPLYFTLHGYAVWLVPSALAAGWSGRASQAWESLPSRVFIDRRSPGGSAGRAAGPRSDAALHIQGAHAPLFGSRTKLDEEISHVTGVGAALVLGDPDNFEIGWGALRLQLRGRRRRHEVSAERLERGVLIGRYERCGVEITSEPEISRVHALLVKIGAEVWIIDTGSTNGIWRGVEPVEAEPLRDVDAVRLGRAVTLTWTRRELPEA